MTEQAGSDGYQSGDQPDIAQQLITERSRLRRRPSMWRLMLHHVINFPVGVVGFLYVVTVTSVGASLSITLIGLPLLAAGLSGARGIGVAERRRAHADLGVRVPEPPPIVPSRPGVLGWVWAHLGNAVAWRHGLYLLLMFPWGLITFIVTLILFVAGWPLLPFVQRGMMAVDVWLARGLLAPSSMSTRVRTLEADRGTVVNAAAADLRRIERDLHDGAQARLVSLAMELGLAKEKLLNDPEAAAKMVEEAHGEAKLALQELRDLARGIHPAILTDRGLDAALSSLAPRVKLPVRINVDLDERPAPAIEGIAYFVTSELLTNVAKHAQASSAQVDLWRVDDRLLIQVRDDGRGGAEASENSGLAGLTERVRSVDGLILIDSPEGGPTAITAELPWSA